jgi:peroxiredoxin
VVVVFLPGINGQAEQELRSLKSKIRTFDSAGAKVFGITTEAPDANRVVHDREDLPFPVLSDPAGLVAARYHAYESGKMVNAVDVIDATGTLMVSMPAEKIRPEEIGQQILNTAQCCFVPTSITVSRLMDDVAPDFSLPRVGRTGNETLYADNRQQATVVIFTSAWCPCATGYDARINTLARRYGGKIRLLEVNSSADESVQQIEEHVKSADIQVPVLKDANNVVADSMNAHVTPEAFVMDARHVLRYQGRIDDDRSGKSVASPDLQHAIDAVLAGKKPLVRHTNGLGCAIVRVHPITSGGS